ncbi:MAG: alanine racemase [Bradymonadia bacterium]
MTVNRTWCEVNSTALAANIDVLKGHLRPGIMVAPTVKGGAYGHGIPLAARAFIDGGAQWLCVDSLDEARVVRDHGIDVPIHVTGYVPLDDLAEAAALDLRLIVYTRETIDRLAALDVEARVHLKLETGNHRQGVCGEEALDLADRVRRAPHLTLEGVSSHFANIEDTTDHSYARSQLARFEAEIAALEAAGHTFEMRHLSNSAATLLWAGQKLEMVRVGIAAYGLWPSRETRVATLLTGQTPLALTPALTWKTRIAQVKWVPEGAYIGYGCTHRTTHRTRLAILPVGYYDGYDRGLSNMAHVLIGGRRAPVRGRVCMNITMVDVTHIPDVHLEQEVVLLGRQGDEVITASMLADWAGTIHYEMITRIADHVPRVDCPEDLSGVGDRGPA